MEPRLPSSRQWTNFPEELAQQMTTVFTDGFKAQLGNAKVEMEGRIFVSELLLSLGFSRPNQLSQPNFEVSITYDPKRDNVLKLIHLLFDAMGALFDQYFTAPDDSEFPRVWEQIDFEGRKLHIQYSTRNTKLESQANEILGVAPNGMVRESVEDDDEEVIEEVKKKLGLEDDDEEES